MTNIFILFYLLFAFQQQLTAQSKSSVIPRMPDPAERKASMEAEWAALLSAFDKSIMVSYYFMQHLLYFFTLPWGQGSFRAISAELQNYPLLSIQQNIHSEK